jgi:hypothetical protein
MVSLLQEKTLVIRESKIVHKSPVIHNLARFVTEKAVCLMFNLSLEDIYTVECWWKQLEPKLKKQARPVGGQNCLRLNFSKLSVNPCCTPITQLRGSPCF